MKKLICLIFVLYASNIFAQDTVAPKSSVTYIDTVSIGVGLGIDYGGIGANFTIYANKNIGFFGAMGYAFAGTGYNFGMRYRYIPDNKEAKIFPTIIGMYGYNTAVVISRRPSLSSVFNGFSSGVGLEYHPKYLGCWIFEILYRYESSKASNYIDYLERSYEIDISEKTIPLAFSVGYRIILN